MSGKASFEIWHATFGVKVHIYYANHGRFDEQSSRSAVGYSNQTITFCGAGSHDQNCIVERQIQNITIGDISFVINSKRYCPEAITTMLWPYALKYF